MSQNDPILECIDNTGAKGEYTALAKDNWREVRKVEGASKGKPFVVPESGNIRLPKFCRGKQIRIFVEVVEDE